MSDLLENKTDSEIEEIYNKATMEDLQNLLIQEKSLGRRRLLRKVMNNKAKNELENSKPRKLSSQMKLDEPNENDIICSNGNFPSKNIGTIPNDVKNINSQKSEKLNELKKKLHDTTDLTERRYLRKEIQELEEKNTTLKDGNTDFNSIVSNINSVGNKETRVKNILLPQKNFDQVKTEKELRFGKKEEVQPSQQRNTIKSSENNVQFKKVENSYQDISKNIRSENFEDKPKSHNINLITNKPYVTDIESEVKIPVKQTCSSHLCRPSPKEEVSEYPPVVTKKTNISRVGSVRELFEKPSQFTAPKRIVSSKPISDVEKNRLINDLLQINKPKLESSRVCECSNSLITPESKQRKTSQTPVESQPRGSNVKMSKLNKKPKTALKDLLLRWIQKNTREYQNVSISNYSKSWADGLAFCALIHHFYPNAFDYDTLSTRNPLSNFKLAFDTAKQCAGIEPLIDPQDMTVLESPDEKCVYTYVQFMYNALKMHPRNMFKRVDNVVI